MRVVGSVLVVNCDTVTVCVATSGAEKVLESSVWIVYELRLEEARTFDRHRVGSLPMKKL
jgi:hypothetical protein